MSLENILKHISYPQILDNIICGIFIVDTEGRILLWNRGMEEITGFSPEEALGRHCTFLETDKCASFDCREGIMNCGLFKQGELRDIRCRLTRRDGRSVEIQRNVRCIYGENNAPIGGIESISDVTELLNTRRQLKDLRGELEKQGGMGAFVGKSRKMREAYTLIEEVAETGATVLITGDSGTGKELAADSIHFLSGRKDGPLVKVNCSALTETLLESELFGHVKGAFTGAVADKTGRFEMADKGSLFLDEIGEINPSIQVKLLRVIQEKEFEKVGSSRPVKVDVRIIAATNRDLADRVKKGLFREDLFYRLNIFPIRMPALSERPEDIPLLISHFVEKYRKETGKAIQGPDADAMALLLDYPWPGNVRELENAIEHAFIRAKGEHITPLNLPQSVKLVPLAPAQVFAGRPELTQEMLKKTLAESKYNRSAAAKALNISRTTLWKRLREFGLD